MYYNIRMQQESFASLSLQEKRNRLKEKAKALEGQISSLGTSSTGAKDSVPSRPTSAASSLLAEQITALTNEAQTWRDKANKAESQVEDLQSQLAAATSSQQALEQKVTRLQTEVQNTETGLSKSYNETLDCLTRHIEELESHTQSINEENDSLRFQLTEAQRVSKFLEAKLTKTIQDQPSQRGVLQPLEGEDQQPVEVMSGIVDEQDEIVKLRQENHDLKEQMKCIETTLSKSYNDTLQGLTEALHEVQAQHDKLVVENDQVRFHATEAQRVSKFLQAKCEQMVRQHEQSTQIHKSQLAEAQFAATEAQRVSKFLQQKCEQLAAQNDQMRKDHEAQLADAQFTATEAQRVSKFLETKCEQLVSQNDPMAAPHESQLADAQFALTETQRVSKFLQKKCEQLVSEKENIEKELGAELASAKFAATEAQRVSKFLQSKCEKVVAEKENMAKVHAEQIAQAQFSSTEAQRVSKFLQSKCEQVVKEKEEMARNHAAQLAEAQFASTEAQRISKFLQQKCEQLVQQQEQQAKEHANKVSELEFQRSEAQRVSTLMQQKLESALASKEMQSNEINPADNEVATPENSTSETTKMDERDCAVQTPPESGPSLGALQERNRELEATIAELKEEAKQTETTLNKSYNETLDSLTSHIELTEKRLKKVFKQNAELKELLRTTDEALEGWEIKCTKIEEAYHTTAYDLQELQEQVEEQTRKHEKEIKKLKKDLDKQERYNRFLDGKVSALEERNAQLLSREQELEGQDETQCEESESKGAEEEHAVEEVSTAEQRQKQHGNSGKQAMAFACQDLDDLSTNTDARVSAVEERNQELEVTIQRLKHEAKQTEATLNKSYNETLEGLTAHIEGLEAQIKEAYTEIEELQQRLAEEQRGRKEMVNDSDAQFQLTEAQRVSKFLQNKLEQVLEKKKAIENENSDLKFQLIEARRVMTFIEAKLETSAETKQPVFANQEEKDDLVFRLTEAQRVSKFLQTKLENVLAEREPSTSDAEKDELAFKLTEAQRVSVFLQGKLEKMLEEKKFVENEKENLSFQLTEAQRVCKFLQGKLETVQQEKKVIQNEKEGVSFQLTEAQRVSKFLQTKLENVLANKTPQGDETENTTFRLIEAQRVTKFLQEKLELVLEQKKSIENEKDDIAFKLSEAQRVTKYLESKLGSANGCAVDTNQGEPEAHETRTGDGLSATSKPTAQCSDVESQLHEKEAEVSLFKEKNSELESKISELKEEVRNTETTLNKSYNETLDGLTNHIDMLQEQIKQLDCENDQLRFQLTDAHRVCQFLQNKIAESDKIREAAAATGEERIKKALAEKDELSFMVTESKRLLSYLENKLVISQESQKNVIYETQNKLTEAQRVAKFLESKLRKMMEEKELAQDAMFLGDVLSVKSTVVDPDLVVRTQQADFASSHASPLASVDEKHGMEIENSELQYKLTESQRICKFLENKIAENEKLNRSVVEEMKSMATEAQRASKIVENNPVKTTDEETTPDDSIPALGTEKSDIRDGNSELQRVCKYLKDVLGDWQKQQHHVLEDVESKLAESQRVSTFLGKKLNKVIAEKQEVMLALENANGKSTLTSRSLAGNEMIGVSSSDEVDKLKARIQELELMVGEIDILKEKVASAEQERSLVAAMKKDLGARIAKFDEELLGADTSSNKTVEDLQSKIQELETTVQQLKKDARAAETALNKSYNDTLDSLTSHIEESENQLREIDAQNGELRFRLTEAQRVCKLLQDKLTSSEMKLDVSEKSRQCILADSEFKLTESQRVTKFLETKLLKMSTEKETATALNESLRKQVETLSTQLEESLVNKADLEGKNSELQVKVDELQKEVRDTETTLNKSYNETLDALTSHIEQSDERLRELDKENSDLRFSLTEAQRVCQYLQTKVDESEKSRLAYESDYGFKLTEAIRLTKFLETKLTKVLEEKQALVSKVEKMDEAEQAKIAQIEELEKGLLRAEKEKDVFKEKAYEIGTRMSVLKKELKEKEEETALLTEVNTKLEEKMSDLKEEIKETEEYLNKSYNDTLSGLTIHIQEAEKRIEELSTENDEIRSHLAEADLITKTLQDKVTETEKSKEALLAESEVKLAEAQRTSTFLETKLKSTIEEKLVVDDRVVELQGKVELLQMEISSLEMVITKQKERLKHQKEEALAELSRDVAFVSQNTLAIPSIESSSKSDLIDALNVCLSIAHSNQKTVEDQVASLMMELTEKENQVQDYKTKWETEVAKTEDLSDQIAQLEQETARRQAQGERTSEENSIVEESRRKPEVLTCSKVNTMGFVCVPVRRIEGHAGTGPLYFL